MARVEPSSEKVTAFWKMADLPEGAKIEYWLENERGDAVVWLWDGSRQFTAEIRLSDSGEYVPKEEDWVLELVCVG
jgi:hypothetical protein